MTRAVAVALLILLLGAGCGTAAGSKHSATPPEVSRQAFGGGADQVWVFRAHGVPIRSVVVFVHGHGDAGEDTPVYHRAWLEHLAREGSAVVYPRYELFPGAHGTVRHIFRAVRVGVRQLGIRRVPVVGIGYSRGGRLVLDWAALETQAGGQVAPGAVLSVFPASGEDPEEDLTRIPQATRIVLLVGDKDEVVGSLGAEAIRSELAAPGVLARPIGTEVVRSTPAFTASHLSVLENSAGARAAFWARADRLIETARTG